MCPASRSEFEKDFDAGAVAEGIQGRGLPVLQGISTTLQGLVAPRGKNGGKGKTGPGKFFFSTAQKNFPGKFPFSHQEKPFQENSDFHSRKKRARKIPLLNPPFPHQENPSQKNSDFHTRKNRARKIHISTPGKKPSQGNSPFPHHRKPPRKIHISTAEKTSPGKFSF